MLWLARNGPQISDSCVAIRIVLSFHPRRSVWDDISFKNVWCFKSSFPTFSSNKYLQPCHSLFQIVLKKKACKFYNLGEVPLLCKKKCIILNFNELGHFLLLLYFFFALFCNCVVVRHFLWAFSTLSFCSYCYNSVVTYFLLEFRCYK